MVFYLAEGRVNGVNLSVSVIARDFPAVVVINMDRVTVEEIRSLDDPAISGAFGLDFVEIVLFYG